MGNEAALLALLQISDSAFPAGGFAHSSGLEQLVRDGRIGDAPGVSNYVASLIRLSVATADAAAASISARAIVNADLARVEEADRALYAMKAPSELRNASTSTGSRLLREVSLHIDEPLLSELLDDVRAGRTPGTYAAAFGAIGGVLGAAPEQVAAALMQSAATAILQASMRLLPISHRDVQATLHRLRPEIAALASEASVATVDELRSFHPVQEIASMRHRTASVRFFAS